MQGLDFVTWTKALVYLYDFTRRFWGAGIEPYAHSGRNDAHVRSVTIQESMGALWYLFG